MFTLKRLRHRLPKRLPDRHRRQRRFQPRRWQPASPHMALGCKTLIRTVTRRWRNKPVQAAQGTSPAADRLRQRFELRISLQAGRPDASLTFPLMTSNLTPAGVAARGSVAGGMGEWGIRRIISSVWEYRSDL